MRDLVLLRHAEALHSAAGGDDRERPLSPHGETEAKAAGRWLAEHDVRPQLTLCSSASRAKRTAELALAELGDCEVRDESVIYAATPGELLALLDTCRDTPQVLLVGHNPGLEQLVALLVSGQSGDFRGMPPAAVAWIRLGDSLEPGAGELHAFWSP